MLQVVRLRGLVHLPMGAHMVPKVKVVRTKPMAKLAVQRQPINRRFLESRRAYCSMREEEADEGRENEALAEAEAFENEMRSEDADDSDLPEAGQTLGNILRHTKQDRFDWGTIKQEVFGEFGKPQPSKPITRLSFVPEPTPDEAVIATVHIPEPLGDFSEYAPTGKPWYAPQVPKPRPILRDGDAVTGMGRRKRAVANVLMKPGDGKIFINGRHWMYYFKDAPVRNSLLEPLTLTESLNQWDIQVQVQGGGFRGQAGAIRLGISRALLNWDPELQPPLKTAGFLTRDKREVERKKPGKLKARRSFQWVKR